jgi:hypothetical protein
MKVNLFFLFAGVALLFCIVFGSIGIFWHYNTNNRIDHYQKIIDEYEGGNETKTLWLEMHPDDPEYKKAVDEKKGAQDDKGLTPLWFVFAVILLLVAIALVVIHFILEKRADDKMAASFFVEGGEAPPRDEPADK